MTPEEKARETRRRHSDSRREKEREKIEIRKKMTKSCLQVLDDPEASSHDKMKAIEILHDMDKGR